MIPSGGYRSGQYLTWVSSVKKSYYTWLPKVEYKPQKIGIVKQTNHATVYLNTQEVRDYVKECTNISYQVMHLAYDSKLFLMLTLKFKDTDEVLER